MSSRILLVDGEPRVTDALQRALRLEDYDISVCNSAEGALAMMESESFDVIISDEQMPGMSGTELLAVVRDRWPDTVRIVLTGQANLEAALRAINEGSVFRFLTKPCRGGDLAGTVHQALQYKRLLAQSSRMLRILDIRKPSSQRWRARILPMTIRAICKMRSQSIRLPRMSRACSMRFSGGSPAPRSA